MADTDLTLPATAATELGVEAGDARLSRLVSAASALVRGFLRRARLHYGSAIVEKATGFGRTRLVLDVTPVLTVASVTIDGAAVTDFVLEEADAGFLYRSGGWPNSALARPGLPPANEPVAGSETPLITVTYAGGWVTPAQAATPGWAGPARSLPFDIEEAALRLVSNLYRSGGQAENIAAEALGAYSVTYADRARVGVLTPSVQQLLAPYVRVAG